MTPRRRRSDTTAVSFFPFLSILVGIIGVLVLVIVASSLSGIRGAEQFVELTPTGETEKAPVYVECNRQGVIVHPEGAFVARDDLDRASSDWQRVIRRIDRNSNSEYLILLIRPSGVDTFDEAFGIARKAGIDIGYDPVYSAGPIRFAPAGKGLRS